MATRNSINTDKPIGVDDGGTGAATLTDHGVLVGSGTGAITALGVATDGQIPIGSTGADPVLANITSTSGSILVSNGAGTIDLDLTFPTDSGTATPAAGVLTIAGGTNLNTSGAGSTATVNLDASIDNMSSIEFDGSSTFRTSTSATDIVFQAYDFDGAVYTSFAVLSSGVTPSMDLDDSVTKANNYIYRGGGTDVPVADGGTGVSTLTDHGLMVGSGTSPVTSLGVATDGQIPIGSTGADPVLANITSTDSSITVTNGAGTIDLVVPGTFSNSFPTDSGTATPAASVLTVAGGTNIATSGAGSTVTVAIDSQIAVANGGTGVATLLDHGVLVGSGTSAITPLSVGATGTLLVGATGADPAFATSAVGDFTFTRSTAGDRVLTVSNTDNTTATSDASLDATTGGSSGGDPQVKYTVTGATTFTSGIDNSDSDKFKISASSALGTTDVFECTTAGEITKPLQPAFGAKAANQTNVTGDGTLYTITFTDAEYFDQNSDFDGTSTFTAPVDGLYQFNANVFFTEMQTAHTSAYIRLDTSNRDYITNHIDPFVPRDGGNDIALQFSFLVDMDASDVATVQFLVSGSIKIIDILGSQTYFNGYLAC